MSAYLAAFVVWIPIFLLLFCLLLLCIQVVSYGNSFRSHGSTSVNPHSSRSHALLQLEVRTGNDAKIGRSVFVDCSLYFYDSIIYILCYMHSEHDIIVAVAQWLNRAPADPLSPIVARIGKLHSRNCSAFLRSRKLLV